MELHVLYVCESRFLHGEEAFLLCVYIWIAINYLQVSVPKEKERKQIDDIDVETNWAKEGGWPQVMMLNSTA